MTLMPMGAMSGQRDRMKPSMRLAATLALVLCLAACGDRGEPGDARTPAAAEESFTFLGMGRGTELTDRLRAHLEETLGHDAVETRGTLDLGAFAPGVLPGQLPELEALNRDLNTPPGERVEHDRTRLMYRYARSKNAPFDLVELVFDPQSRRPLMFRMRFKGDEAGMLDSLRARYGQPQDVALNGGRALVWRKAGDSLVVYIEPDHFGTPVHQVSIFYADNLQRWAAAEPARSPKPKANPPGKSTF
jgi:hypothetical protein